MLGVRDRMEIWDRETCERYEAAFAGAYQSGHARTGEVGGCNGTNASSATEVRQSLSLMRMTALTLLRRSAFGMLVGHVG